MIICKIFFFLINVFIINIITHCNRHEWDMTETYKKTMYKQLINNVQQFVEKI